MFDWMLLPDTAPPVKKATKNDRSRFLLRIKKIEIPINMARVQQR